MSVRACLQAAVLALMHMSIMMSVLAMHVFYAQQCSNAQVRHRTLWAQPQSDEGGDTSSVNCISCPSTSAL